MTSDSGGFKDWTVEKELGRGGQSIIYLASRKKLNGSMQKAAIRTMNGVTSGRSPKEIQMERLTKIEQFAHEYEILEQLHSPFIAKVLDFGETPEPWIATELIDGQDLSKVIRTKQKMPEAEWNIVATGLLSGLAHAHSRGVIHQDVKPGNIMISGGNGIWIDFSSATLRGKEEIGFGGQAYTPVYTAPERLQQRGFYPVSDVFSLGIVLFELAAGIRPWQQPDSPENEASMKNEILKMVAGERISFRGLTPKQQILISKMLAPQVDERPSAEELLKLMDSTQTKESIRKEHRITVPEESSEPSHSDTKNFFEKHRRKWWFWLLAIYFVGILPVIGYFYFLYREASKKREPLSERFRSIASWLAIVFPLLSISSAALAFVWALKSKKLSHWILASLQAIAGVAIFSIYITSPTAIDETGELVAVLGPEIGVPVAIGIIAAIVSTITRPRYAK
jgi:serine/threonine protein kinase